MQLYFSVAETFIFTFYLDDVYELNEVRVRHGANVEWMRPPSVSPAWHAITVSLFDAQRVLLERKVLPSTYREGIDYEIHDVGAFRGVTTFKVEIPTCDGDRCLRLLILLRDVVLVGRRLDWNSEPRPLTILKSVVGPRSNEMREEHAQTT